MDNNKKMNNSHKCNSHDDNNLWWTLSMDVTQDHMGYFIAKIRLGDIKCELESRSMTELMLKVTRLVSREENSASVRYGMSQLVDEWRP